MTSTDVLFQCLGRFKELEALGASPMVPVHHEFMLEPSVL
jgi:hypothetical protein